MQPDLTTHNIYHLAALHQQARKSGHLITCELIQVEISKRSLFERVIAGKLRYYVPVESKVLFNN